MKSNTYILKKITDLSNAIPQITIRYEYDKSCDSHFVEVSPINEFESNRKYIALEKEIRLEFINLFPFEILTFISEEDGIILECPTVIKGKHKEINKKFNLEDVISTLFEDESYSIDWQSKISFKVTKDGLILNYDSSHSKKMINNTEKNQNPAIYTIADTIFEKVKIDYECDSMDNDYPLAA